MCAIVVADEEQPLTIPDGIEDQTAFLRWVESEEFPERGRIYFLDGKVWVDRSPEELFTHNQVKGEHTIVLGGLTKTNRLGRFIPDGMLLTNRKARISTQPDGMFISAKSWRTGKVRLVRGRRGFLQIKGILDMVLEVISASSVHKDTVLLRDLYWRAGISEYWLVDAYQDPLYFAILRHTSKGYVPARKHDGWQRSEVFGKAFKLTVADDELGQPEYTLAVR